MATDTNEIDGGSSGSGRLRLLVLVGVIALLIWLARRSEEEEEDDRFPFSDDLVERGVDLGGYTLCGPGCHDQPGPNDPNVSCATREPDCTDRGECSCHLFSIQAGADRSDPDNWRHEAGPGEERVRRAGREYHCFCVSG